MTFEESGNIARESVIMTENDAPSEVDMIDEGWHTSQFVNYEVIKDVPITGPFAKEGETRDKIVMWFESDGARVRRTVNRVWGPRSNFKKLIAGMLGKSVDERFGVNLDDLVGKRYDILIGHNERDGYTYVNVEKARPAKAKQGKVDG